MSALQAAMPLTLRSRPHSDGGSLYWWNCEQGWNAFARTVPPQVFRTASEALEFIAGRSNSI